MMQQLPPIDETQRQIVSAGGIRLLRLQSDWARFSASWISRRQWRREIRQLQAFSDRELRDVGLSRSDLHAITKSSGKP